MAEAESGTSAGRSTPKRKGAELNYMYATLGIERDDSSDDDFVPDEDGDDDQVSDDFSDDSEELPKLAAKDANRQQASSKRRFSPHEMRPSKKSRVVLEDETCRGNDSASGDTDRGPTASTRPEYTPRKHMKEMEAMRAHGDEIVNVVSPFPSGSIANWKEFSTLFKTCTEQNNIKFRVRSSESTERYNSTHDDPIPTDFLWAHKIFRCTHDVSQSSRSKGHRNRKTRYCGCNARFTAVVAPTDDGEFIIKIINENHTHSHPTTASQASSYLTTKTLTLDEQDRDDVKTLVDARVSSKHISNFLNERIVTPQQTRNLIRHIMGNDSAEERLKTMRHALRQVDDSDVLVPQDQLGLTTAIVMQTKVQKIMFDHWGETMDFTHGTNNLGYHLGSLVVTTATGRGFPVFDFVCLNEQALTVSTILNYFKEKNPGWRRIESVVIDKDYVEWSVLK
ncbi:hypothetical protein PF001_g28369 [Phytophthora fragariae]|uniref:MULE transposase domain-containing protein n=4 Tax=Phytophthora fragariae TaxID=53985 RepID=A0A6A4BE68_9STRA|nr:hypothetical protein PF001_g28369 [Phytophthora fragariae]